MIELDEHWSYVGSKNNQQWLWLVFHSATRQILAMHVGRRTHTDAECLLVKLSEDLKRKALFYTDKFLSILRSPSLNAALTRRKTVWKGKLY
ncbi:hypothetical protein PHSC3_000244 [Chlamydiales bacterium STE3]|nr:hypothetical protein PHSC3_000244 [Chlamydiales bacterium STE3]